MSRTIAITGASGYLGGVVRERFVQAGWSTVSLVRSPKSCVDRRFVLGESVDPALLGGVDVLLHCAYDMSLTTEEEIWRVNVDGTRRLLDAAVAAGVRRTIVISSMSAYRGTSQLYGRAKCDIERLTHERGGVVVRPGLVIGPEAGGVGGALGKLTRLPITLSVGGAGHQFLIGEGDLIDAIRVLAAAENAPSVPLGFAYPEPLSFSEVLGLLAGMHGRDEVRLVPIPWQAIYAALRLGERSHVKLPFRSDSLLGLVRPAPSVPGVEDLAAMGIHIPRPGANATTSVDEKVKV